MRSNSVATAGDGSLVSRIWKRDPPPKIKTQKAAKEGQKIVAEMGGRNLPKFKDIVRNRMLRADQGHLLNGFKARRIDCTPSLP